MATVTIDVQGEQLQQLQVVAERNGISAEELLRRALDAYLSDEEEAFQRVAEYVFRKNAELYRRLAQ